MEVLFEFIEAHASVFVCLEGLLLVILCIKIIDYYVHH